MACLRSHLAQGETHAGGRGRGGGGGHQNFFSGHPCMPSASFLEGRVAACSFLGSRVSTRPHHTVCPTPFPVACLSLVLRAAHTDLVRPLSFRSATFLASYFAFQVIRRPAAPIEFCRPHAPTGLELDPIHYLFEGSRAARELISLRDSRRGNSRLPDFDRISIEFR